MIPKKLITHRWPLLLPLGAACLLASACSSIRLGYGAMPMWLGWQVDRHPGLDDAQRELVSAQVDALHRWHRQTQLPACTTFRASVQARLAPDVAALARTLRPEQFGRMHFFVGDLPGQREREVRMLAATGDALSATVLAQPEQRRQLHERLRGLADDFSALAAR